MSLTSAKYCLYYRLIVCFMLFYQFAGAQRSFDGVDKWLEANTPQLGGRTVLMIYKDGKVIYTKAVNELTGKEKFLGKYYARKTGRDAAEMLADFSPDHKIAIASCSKWLSAALVMTFVDEGKLKLSDTVGRFLPVLANSGKGKITIAECLSHTTGIKSGNIRDSREGFGKAATMDEAMQSIAAMDTESAPGASFHYSSVGLQIAAAVIEKISGKDFRTLFAERIAVPCEMKSTDFGNAPVPVAAGSASSTAADYLRFLQMILANGMYQKKRILSASSVALMQENYTAGKKIIYTPIEAGDWNYGLGEWMPHNVPAGERSDIVTSPGLFGSEPWVNNKKKYAAVLFTFYLKNEGRLDRFVELMGLVDKAVE